VILLSYTSTVSNITNAINADEAVCFKSAAPLTASKVKEVQIAESTGEMDP
jgi:hypothetical protein